MKSAQHGEFDNRSCASGLADSLRSFIVIRYAPTDALVWATLVEMRTERSQRSSKVVFAQDQDVVQAFAAHTSKEPLADRVAVRRERRDSDDGRSTADGDSIKDATELTVIISNEEPGAVVERHRFAKLLSGLLVRRVSSDVAVNDLAAVETYDEEREDRSENEVIQLQEVASPDLILMILKEGLPCLSATTIWPDAPNVPLDRSFADSEPEREKFPSNSLAAPSMVV